jgi:class 3 adenylate cyclase/tetratricopeptide (TPR) repeat protein
VNCAVCGNPLPEGARFCPNCGSVVGTPLGTEERKMVTVLFADLVDSTGLARRLDAERAREILGRFFDAASQELQALRGRPEKFIGDAVMAVFGLPTVSEDDALRAVRAGLAIRGRVKRLGDDLGLGAETPLEVRIGIESGEAATGLGPAGQLLVTGPVVNAAARLQAAAEPGEVLAGETTRALTAASVSYGPRRDVPAKGFDGDLAAQPVATVTPRSARRTIPFVGRVSELAILRESLARATATGRPVLVTVLGEPGIGKSRLADELVAGLGDEVTVLSGRLRTFTDTATFAPAAAIVGDLAGIDEEDPPEKAKRRLTELAERATPDDARRQADRLALLFGLTERRDEHAFVQDVQAGFVALIDGLSRQTPVLLVFEDAQSIRPPMLQLIERLGTRPRNDTRRAMVLVLARPELVDQRPTWGTSTDNAITLRLDPLSGKESVELARQAAGGRIDEAEAAEIAARADGNPFFIIETTGMLLPETAEGASTAPRAAIPPTVQAVVSARLDALPPRLRDLARKASVFFVSFDLDELRAIDADVTLDELHELEEAEIVVREERRDPARWRVRHATVKDVAYASLPKRERVRLHEIIANGLLERDHPTWAADHLELAAQAALDLDPDDRRVAERAADALLEAGDRARRRMESRTAIEDYERALALAGPEDGWGVREARVLAGMGEAHYWLGEYPAAVVACERAVNLGNRMSDPFTLALALRFLGDIAINVEGDVDKAEKLLDGSLAAAEQLGDPWAIVRTLLFAGWVPWTRSDNDEAERIWRRALEIADPDDGWARVRALNSLSINQTGGPEPGPTRTGDTRTDAMQRALELSDEASALAEEIDDPFSIAMTTVQRSRVLEDLGRFDEALAGFDRAVPVFEELGARWELGDALAERGVSKRELGMLDEAEQDMLAAIRISEELGERQLASWVWKALARISERRGDPAEAERRRRRSSEAEAQRPR